MFTFPFWDKRPRAKKGALRSYSRAVALALGAVTSAAVFSGCGSGGGTSPSGLPVFPTSPIPIIAPGPNPVPTPTPDPNAPVVRAAVVVLPTDGSVQISAVTADTVTLSGPGVPILAPGAVIVSGEGSGLLRKVVSSSAAGGQTVLQTGPATLEDVFEKANIEIKSRPFSLADFTNVTLAPGVTVVNGDATDAETTAALDALAAAQGKAAMKRGRATTNTFTFTLPVTNLAAGDGHVTVDGTLAVTLSLDANIKIDNSGVNYVLFKPTVVGVVKLVGRSTYKTSFAKSFTYAQLDGAPITIQVGPVPVVFTPHFNLSINASGTADVGLTLTSRARVSAATGAEYTRASGWTTTLDWNKYGSFLVGRNLFATVDGDITPAHLELGLDLYGAATGSIKADYPTINFHLAHESKAPAGIRFTETALYHAYAGYDVSILGHSLTSYNSGDFINGTDKWEDQFFPDNGGINLGVQ